MRIGFFGDSFCADYKSLNSYDTYIKKIADYTNSEVVNLGVSGSSVSDIILLQLKPYKQTNQYPDICVFVWTEPNRLFNREFRNLNSATVVAPEIKSDIHKAADSYYKYLHDIELAELQYVALLQYIDTNILSSIPDSTKIIHLWSFGKWAKDFSKESLSYSKIDYWHRWQNGVEIRPSLMSIQLLDSKSLFSDSYAPNHIDNEFKNNLIFNAIKSALDNYKDGCIIDLTNKMEQYVTGTI